MNIDNIIDLLDEARTKLEQLNKETIHWTVLDFEDEAQDTLHYEKYDPKKFQEALELMIHKHDAMIGINLNTIRTYLDEYCLKDGK